MPEPDVSTAIRDEVDETLEYLRRRVGAMRPPRTPPASVEERMAKIRRQIELLKDHPV